MGAPEPQPLQPRQTGGPCPPPRASPLLYISLGLSLLQLSLTAGCSYYIWQRDFNEISGDHLQCLKLISTFNQSSTKLTEVEMVTVSEACSQLLQGLKNIVDQVVHSAFSRQRHSGHTTESTESLQSHHPRNPLRPTPCAHLTMKRAKDSPGLKTKFIGLKGKPITSWEEKIGLAHTTEMSHNQGLLKIKHHGLYYIYAQILFRYHAENPISTKEYQLVQYVYWKTANYRTPSLILKGAGTWCSGNHNLYSVYLGGVFNLHRDDEIFVTVSNISLVDADETSSYLGAFKLN